MSDDDCDTAHEEGEDIGANKKSSSPGGRRLGGGGTNFLETALRFMNNYSWHY
jgi:hypothetical protein